MNPNEHTDATTTDTDQSHLHLALGVRKLKIFAGIQIGFGVACITACTYLLTGMFPLCMTDSQKPRWKCLKITFLVFSIINAVVFSPAMLSIGLLSVFIIDLENDEDIITVSAIIDACAVIEMIVSITAATYCCCCSQMLPDNQQNVVIFNPIQERVIHTVTQLQGPPVNQHGVIIPQGYQQQYVMPNTHVQLMTQQSPGQVLVQGQHNNGMENVNLGQHPGYMQPNIGHQND
ncbi:Hypothetical predicted protein [Mytilus galloprovincialis]|uniref:Transmembrane protein n=1 Tax=Mytilus galloprovincialis TaxID=29158 RepID=A0A8B6GIV0_MYTGA|nr:Hypothetical predicted protein [Mytilus galloprovincialis]